MESMSESKNESSSTNLQTSATISKMFQYADSYDAIGLFVGIISASAVGASMPILMVLMGQQLDNLNGSQDSLQQSVNKTSTYYVIVGSGAIFFSILQVMSLTFVGERNAQRIREKYVKAILAQDVGWFDSVGASELSTKVADYCGKIQNGLSNKIGDLIMAIMQFMTGLGAAFYTCWQLTVVLLAAFPIIAIAGIIMMKAYTDAQNESSDQYAAAGGLASEQLTAVRTVTALNAQPDAITRYRKYIMRGMYIGTVKGFKVGVGIGTLYLAIFLSNALGFWYGAKLIADQKDNHCTENCLTGGKVMTVFWCTIIGSMALGQIAPAVNAFFTAKAAAGSVFEVIDRKPLIDGLSDFGEKPSHRPEGNIELRDVYFAYPTRPQITVCDSYNLNIKAGESLALCGPSGSGKSTVMALLLRFYDPQSGQIFLDDKDIRTLNVRWLRSVQGYVGQEPVLFAGTIGDNISFGIDRFVEGELDEATVQARVEAAARQANAHEFIMELPQGYQTDVGAQGALMSGGQKQRIAIARALIKRPAILLLDEATSALDAASEKIVQASIDALQASKSQTTIIIAHRLSTIRNCDRIAVVNNGKVVELGTHDELYALRGIYKDLVDMQMGNDPHSTDVSHIQPLSQPLYALSGPITHTEINVEKNDDFDLKRSNNTYKQLVKGTDAHLPSTTGHHAVKSPGGTVSVVAKPAEVINLSNGEKHYLQGKIWELVRPHFGWLLTGFIGACMVGVTFPLWGYLLASVQTIFYYKDTSLLRADAALNAEYFIALGVGAFFGFILQNYCISQIGERITAVLRSDLFESILRREIAFFDDVRNSVGVLTVRLADDPRLVHESTGETLANQLQAFVTLAVGLSISFSASWKITLVILACFPITVIAGAMRSQRTAGDSGAPQDEEKGKKGRRKRQAMKAMPGSESGSGPNGLIAASFTNIRTVSALSMHHAVGKRYTEMTQALSLKRRQGSGIIGFFYGVTNSASAFTNALVYWYGASLITSGEIDFQQLMTAMMALMLSAMGLGAAMNGVSDQKEGLLATKRIFTSIDEGVNSKIDGLSQIGLKPESRLQGRIELRNVNFHYPSRPDIEVSKNYSLTIEAGTTVALVGPSGSGKSTIINLLLRNYDPIDGQISIDGIDIKELNVRFLRAQIGYVGQEPVLFSGSIEENIIKGRAEAIDIPLITLPQIMQENAYAGNDCLPCFMKFNDNLDDEVNRVAPAISTVSIVPTTTEEQYGELDTGRIRNLRSASYGVMSTHTDEEKGDAPPPSSLDSVPDDVIEAAVASNAHDFICTFTDGYKTNVGTRGALMSGGQKQRIAIARALIKQPAILLLDEATSALDAASEKIVQASIDALQTKKSHTTIIIAHRLTTIVNADNIVVIDKGQIYEQGTHEELLSKGGLYSTLWAKQQQTSTT